MLATAALPHIEAQERLLLRLGYRVLYKHRGAPDSDYVLHTITSERGEALRVKRDLEAMKEPGVFGRWRWTVQVRRGR